MTETHEPTDTPSETVSDAAATTNDVVATDETTTSGQASGADDEMEEATVEALVAAWRTELGEEGSVSASDVQDRLLDLWGEMPDGAARSQVERWLTETLARHLYAVDDVQRRLETVLAAD